MEDWRRQRWNNHRRSTNKKPPHGSWQPTVPSWEKEFCKVIGSMEWEKFLQLKKFMYLYPNVIEWNDSAGKEAFSNAKKRFWTQKNGFSCDLSLPDPDLYIDEIDWDSEINPMLLRDLESAPVVSDIEEDNDPVVIFGDSLMPYQGYTSTGWGDDDENFKAPAADSSANNGDPWGNSLNGWAAWPNSNNTWQGYPNDMWQGYPNGAWQGYSNDAWQSGDGRGPDYPTWGGGWNNEPGWSYANNYAYARGDGEQGRWYDSNVTTSNARGYESSYKTSRAQGNEERRNYTSRNGDGRRKPPYSRRQSGRDRRSTPRESNAIQLTAGQTWDQE